MKKGFTLIELLAVIVILAIIALIATPIVLSIISDSKESSGLRSAEMYLDAVEQAVSIEKMNNTSFNPNSCDITKEGNLYCEGYEDKIEVEVKGEKPINGNITFEEGKITNIRLEYKNDKVIIKDEDGNLVYEEEPTLTYTSLGNYQHKASDGTVEAHDTESGTCSKCGETVLTPGLYDAEGNMTMSWQELIDGEYLFVNNGELVADTADTGNCTDTAYEFFYNKKLVIDNNITSIGDCGFEYCLFADVIFPNSLTSIGGYAFAEYSCSSLVIPNSVTYIGGQAFFNAKLTSITISSRDLNIDENAFQECYDLTDINYLGTKEQWNAITLGEDWNMDCPEITVHCTDGDITIPAWN